MKKVSSLFALVVTLNVFTASSVSHAGGKLLPDLGAARLKTVALPGGTFSYTEGFLRGGQTHDVTVAPFKPMETHLTRYQWREIMSQDPDLKNCEIPPQEKAEWGQNLQKPVTCVSWDDIQAMLKQLRWYRGIQARLMTDTEAEYLMRLESGKSLSTDSFPASFSLEDLAWHRGNSGAELHRVKTKQAIEGIYDARGNVYTWTGDSFSAYDTYLYLIRGGSYETRAEDLRSSNRSFAGPDEKLPTVGVRLVVEYDPRS